MLCCCCSWCATASRRFMCRMQVDHGRCADPDNLTIALSAAGRVFALAGRRAASSSAGDGNSVLLVVMRPRGGKAVGGVAAWAFRQLEEVTACTKSSKWRQAVESWEALERMISHGGGAMRVAPDSLALSPTGMSAMLLQALERGSEWAKALVVCLRFLHGRVPTDEI